MADLMRANRVAVKANGENYIADFYRTHKAVASIHSENTEWTAPTNAVNKLAARESFRLWAIENCKDFNINYDAVDRRTEENIRRPKYESDEVLVNDAMSIMLTDMKELVDKVAVKYPIEWGGVAHDEIVPMTTTPTGKDLSGLGITNGKYNTSQNWAWANVNFTVTIKYKGEECYIPISMQLVSGQIKKAGIGIMDFTSKVKAEILANGLATEQELDPPKEKSKTKKDKVDDTKADTEQADTKVEEPKVEPAKEKKSKTEKSEEKPKRQRRSKKNKDAESKAE